MDLSSYIQALKDRINNDPELSTYADIGRTALKGVKQGLPMTARLAQNLDPMLWATKTAGNPEAQGDMLGALGHVPDSQAIVNPELLTAGGQRMYDALKNLAERKQWAQKALEYMEGPEMHENISSDFLNKKLSTQESPIDVGNTLGNWNKRGLTRGGYYDKSILKVPGLGPKRAQELGKELENVPLPETRMQPMESTKAAWDAHLDELDKANQAKKAEELTPWQQYLKDNYDSPSGNLAPKQWPYGGAIRPETDPDKVINSGLIASPGGKSPMAPSNPTGQLSEVPPLPEMTPVQSYLQDAKDWIQNSGHFTSSANPDQLIYDHAIGKFRNDYLDRLMERHRVGGMSIANEMQPPGMDNVGEGEE